MKKSIVLAAVASALALGLMTASATASPIVPHPVVGPSAIENVYYYHGHYYPYRYHGHYYKYRYGGHYYNHRRRVGNHWRYY